MKENSVWLTGLLAAVVSIAGVVGTPREAGAATLTPTHDSYVDANRTGSTFGGRSQLRVEASPERVAYLKFNVSEATGSAALRIFIETTTMEGLQVRTVTDTSPPWTESTLTYLNRPAVGEVIAATGPATGGKWYTLDVSPAVANGTVSLALTTSDPSSIYVTSKEGARPPALLVPAPAAPMLFTVTASGSGVYRAESPYTGTAYSGSLKFVVESAVVDLNLTGGGTVQFAAGLFDLGSDHWEFYSLSNITFAGAGVDLTFVQNNSSLADDTEPFDFSGTDRVTVQDMTVAAGGPARSTSDAIDFDRGNNSTVQNVRITASRARGIVFDGKNAGWTSEGNIVKDCTITGVPSDGIELLASSKNRIEGCVIQNVGGHGIQINKSSTVADQPNKKSNDNQMVGNVIDNAGQDGINVTSGDRNLISGNRVTNSSDDTSGRDGIRITSVDTIACDENVVEGNTATDNQSVKTQRYGLNIAHAQCHATVVKNSNAFSGNAVAEIRDLGTGTVYESVPDSEPPSQPQGLEAVALAATRVQLTWQAASDNVGVVEYRIVRDGLPLAAVSGSQLVYLDETTAAQTTYRYAVTARDAAGNESAPSATAEVTTPDAGPVKTTYLPDADTYVNASSPASNYGTSTSLRVDASPDLRSYLRFTVGGVEPGSRAVLRVYANSSSNAGFVVHTVTDTAWGETVINYSNAPAFQGAVGSTGPFSGGAYIEIDISSSVTADGPVSLALVPISSTAISFGSRESVNPPQLVITQQP